MVKTIFDMNVGNFVWVGGVEIRLHLRHDLIGQFRISASECFCHPPILQNVGVHFPGFYYFEQSLSDIIPIRLFEFVIV